jgi:hypothetical protein
MEEAGLSNGSFVVTDKAYSSISRLHLVAVKAVQ